MKKTGFLFWSTFGIKIEHSYQDRLGTNRESTLKKPHAFSFFNDRIAKQTALALTVLEKHEAWRGRGGVPANVRDLRGRGATDETAATPEVDHYIALWSQALNRAWQKIARVNGGCAWPPPAVICACRLEIWARAFDVVPGQEQGAASPHDAHAWSRSIGAHRRRGLVRCLRRYRLCNRDAARCLDI